MLQLPSDARAAVVLALGAPALLLLLLLLLLYALHFGVAATAAAVASAVVQWEDAISNVKRASSKFLHKNPKRTGRKQQRWSCEEAQAPSAPKP